MQTILLKPVLVSAPVMSQYEVAPQHFRLHLHSSTIASAAQAGQFVHLLTRSLSQTDPLLRRAFSIVNVEGDSFEVLYRILGRGTECLSKLKSGDTVNVLGPLGCAFAPPTKNVLLVGGGVGVPPLAMLATQIHRSDTKTLVEAYVGARNAKELLCLMDFEGAEVRVQCATDDGSQGHHGYVTELVRRRIEDATILSELTVYACGPWAMLREVANLCTSRHIPCQVSLEEIMPCGIGVCNGCVIPVHKSDDEYSRYRRVCVEGPAIWSHQVDWGNKN